MNKRTVDPTSQRKCKAVPGCTEPIIGTTRVSRPGWGGGDREVEICAANHQQPERKGIAPHFTQ